MSKMGISVINSYRGGCNFEAIGLSRNLMSKYFPSMSSKISGIGINGIERRSRIAHDKAYEESVITCRLEEIIAIGMVAKNMLLKQDQFTCFKLR